MKRKATFLINSFSTGGAEKVLSILIAELRKKKYHLEVIFLENNNYYDIPEEVKVTYLTSSKGDESGIKKLISLPILAFKLKKYIKKNRIKSIQSHLFRANYVNVLAKILGANHISQVVTAGRISRYKELGFIGKINLFLIKVLYSKSDLIVSKAYGMQNDMQKLFNFNNEKVVINNPYDIEKIRLLSSESISDFTFNDEKKYLISVGRLISLKRNQDLIQALKKLNENIEIIFLGDGEERDSLQSLVKRLNLESRVHFLGQVLNPFKYIAKSDIFINCSESEGFPNVLVESMICKTVVISTDCVSGPREILAPDTDVNFQLKNNYEIAKYGLLFQIGDVENLVNAINFLLDNKELKKEYKQNCVKRIEDFSVNKITTQYEKVLNVE